MADTKTTYTPVEQLTFKQASLELEGIVRSLEAGDLELEESLDRYNRGVELLKSLRERLSTAEQKVQVLLGEIDDEEPAADTASAPKGGFFVE